MKKLGLTVRLALVSGALAALTPTSAWACAACYGASDSPMAKGMNWGILTLLGCIGLVLGGVAAFALYLSRRAAAPAPAPEPQLAQPTPAPWVQAPSKA